MKVILNVPGSDWGNLRLVSRLFNILVSHNVKSCIPFEDMSAAENFIAENGDKLGNIVWFSKVKNDYGVSRNVRLAFLRQLAKNLVSASVRGKLSRVVSACYHNMQSLAITPPPPDMLSQSELSKLADEHFVSIKNLWHIIPYTVSEGEPELLVEFNFKSLNFWRQLIDLGLTTWEVYIIANIVGYV